MLGASWYFDNAASGANNGTSWTDAWQNTNSLNWDSVLPGDTLYISGGSTTKIYTESIICRKSGTNGGWITLKIGQDAGHNGVAVFDGVLLSPGPYVEYVAIDGARSASFSAPTNHQQVPTITNNIGFKLDGLYSATPSSLEPVMWMNISGQNLRYSWVEVCGITNSSGHSAGAVAYGNCNNNSTTNIIWEYLYLHDNLSGGFIWVQSPVSTFDTKIVQFCWMDKIAEDHFKVSDGWTIRDSIIGPVSGDSGHTDLFQLTGNYFRIYNNDIRESMNSVLRYQTQGEGFSHSFYFFNNIMAEVPGRALYGGTRNEYFVMVHWDSQESNGAFHNGYSNIVIANNLWFNSVINTFGDGAGGGDDEMCRTAALSMSRGYWVTNKSVHDMKFVNNLVVDKEKGVSFAGTTNIYPTLGYWTYTTNDLWIDYNSFPATNTALTTPRQVTAFDQDILKTNSVYQFSNNTNYPAFEDAPNYNFELQSTDTVALNTGYPMTNLFTFDALNRPRTGAWDRGPFELQSVAQETNLLVWLRFEDDFTNQNYAADSSGNGYHGWRMGKPTDTTKSNWPARIAASDQPGVNSNGYAAQFTAWTNSTYSQYDREGTYIALTNHVLTNLNKATFAFWGIHYPPKFGGDYLQIQNNAFIDAGSGSAGRQGGWQIGKSSSPQTRFSVLTNTTGSTVKDFSFPDAPENPSGWDGSTTNWNHYAVTWDSGVIELYFNGSNCLSADVSSACTNLIIAPNFYTSKSLWIAIGVHTHGGDWDLDDAVDDYPNHGWLHGAIDDVRIYNRALSAAEVLALVQPSSEEEPDPEPDPDPPSGNGAHFQHMYIQDLVIGGTP